ncbi:uncharacterized protein LOC133393612 isoform X1 [Anopheles gambiae]|uniref:uncharacterized protein LOC133393612 isoform X1 n=1 Tax=Anopheles gambiae TaxID=7165 RepID=UPI002AC9D39D|nr:uncharacterized protein LOC133393612 isoform X1 [Anopheles gambiae]
MHNLSLPVQSVSSKQLMERYKHLRGVPFSTYYNQAPRILIGTDNSNLGKPIKTKEGKNDEPIALKTRLGWTIYGRCPIASSSANSDTHCFHICECEETGNEALTDAVKRYFALESLGIFNQSQTLMSTDDTRAIQILTRETHLKSGRFETGLLWKYDDVRLPCNKDMALRRNECLRKKMRRDPALAKAIIEKMRDYERKGYIRRVEKEELVERKSRDWYLPIFPVINQNKPGNLRMVFDAAAKVHGVSLNTFLLSGPDQLAELMSVLHKFREFRVAVAGDIREMFFQINMKKEDQRSQLIFWDEKETYNAEPTTYAVTVMTFGATCSPGTAHFVKNNNAERFAEQFPRAIHCIKYEHYVDDMLASAETSEEAAQLAETVRHIHAEGGFEIRNWVSNSNEVLERLRWGVSQEDGRGVVMDSSAEKVLGMWWETTTDSFIFRLNLKHDKGLLSGTRMPTKREVLRTLMLVYDPLGLVGNFLMFMKILLQEIWRAGYSWDQQIDRDCAEKWLKWISALPSLQSVRIPRCYRVKTSAAVRNVQLHIFCDASENGMAAVAYFRFEEDNTIECSLIGSKTRVSPLKFLSIPRLELQATVIGVRLATSIVKYHRMKITRRIFWTDSRNVMSWLKSDHRRYGPFVAFRVSELLESTVVKEWRWLPTKANVADE